jgi:putative FmdB family regulatory protein
LRLLESEMPIYEYRCKSCGHVFSLLQGVAANREGAQCPNCCGKRTERIISRFSAGKSGACNPKSPFT